MKIPAIILTIAILMTACVQKEKSASTEWTYFGIDSCKQKWGDWDKPRWLRYFGIDFGDVNRDGNLDIISGRYIYKNPGGDLSDPWNRTSLDENVDAIFYLDADNDQFADIIAQALPGIYWYEALDLEGTTYMRRQIASIPATSHVNSQGFEKAQIIIGGKMELLIASNGSIYCITIPDDPENTDFWPTYLIAENTSDEGIGVGDIDNDGDLDIACGRRQKGDEEPLVLVWYENPGSIDEAWNSYEIGRSEHPIDRVELGDLDGDGNIEIVVTEERYPGLEPDGHLLWFSSTEDIYVKWERHSIIQQYSMNSLDLADFDADGDIDIVTNEHKGLNLETQIWINDGNAVFTKFIVDTGKENHLGTQAVDIDGDGDVDIAGCAWDNYGWTHLWRNNTVSPGKLKKKKVKKAKNDVTIFECSYEGRPHFLVRTNELTYYYDKLGGGFSRIIDKQGNDWVSFKMEPWRKYPAAAAGAFRGTPNMVYGAKDNGVGHPGHDQCNSYSEDNKISTESKSGLWSWNWEFFSDHAIIDITKVDKNRNYWFLYEGTPGGLYKPATSYFGSDKGGPVKKHFDYFNGDILRGNFQWMYAGNNNALGILYLLQMEKDKHSDMISIMGNTEKGLNSPDGMTVFGFGRGEGTKAFLASPQRFIIGLYPNQINTQKDHDEFSVFLRDRYQVD